MASPTVNARTNTATGLSVNLGSPVAGELLIVFSTFGPVSGVASQPSVDTAASGNGWHLIGKANTNNGAGTSVCTVYFKIAAGSDVLTFRASQNGNYSHICYRITGHGSAVTVASATGSSTTADPPNCAQSGSAQDALALAFAGVTSSTAPSGAPAGYGTLTTQAGYQILLYECHEGNRGLEDILSAARAYDRAVADAVKNGTPLPPSVWLDGQEGNVYGATPGQVPVNLNETPSR